MLPTMGSPDERPSLDQIATENALLWLRRRVAARVLERKPYYLHTLAEELLEHVVARQDLESPEFSRVVAIDKVGRTVARCLGINRRQPKIAWRLDYLEGFANVMGVDVFQMLTPQPQLAPDDHDLLWKLTGSVRWIVPVSGTKSKPEP